MYPNINYQKMPRNILDIVQLIFEGFFGVGVFMMILKKLPILSTQLPIEDIYPNQILLNIMWTISLIGSVIWLARLFIKGYREYLDLRYNPPKKKDKK